MTVTSDIVHHGRYTTIRQRFPSEVPVFQTECRERSLGNQGQQKRTGYGGGRTVRQHLYRRFD
jgi:hypothetical protein